MTDAIRSKFKINAGRTNKKKKKKNAENHRKFYMAPLATAVAAALCPSGPVIAQESASEIDEITVTATKRELNLQDVAQSITVLTAEHLAKLGARDLEATLRAVPSVNLTALQPGQNSLVIRGISSGPYQYRTEAQVAVYLDEQPMTFNSQQVGIRNIDLNRIEVLPGPQGTLFGSSSQTGTIRYITNKPTTSGVLGSIEGRYGNTSGGADSYDISGFVNIPFGDSFAIRAAAYTALDGGYVDNVLGTSFNGNYDNANLVENDFNEYDVSGGRLHAQWNMGEKWSVLLSLVAEETTADGVWDSDEALGDYKVTRFSDEIRTDDWYSTAITLSGDLGFADLTFTATNFDRDIVYEYDNMTYSQYKDRNYAGRYLELYYAGDPAYINYSYLPLYYANYNRSIIFNDQTQERETLEFRLVSKGDSRFQWMVGGYYEDITDKWFYGTRIEDHLNTTSWYTAQAYAAFYSNYHYSYYTYNYYSGNPNQAYPIPDTDIGYSNILDRSVSQTAFFGEASFDLNDSWTIHGGIRWAEFDRDIFSKFAFPHGLITFGDRSTGDGSFRELGKDEDTIYKIGVRYNIDDDRMVYGLFSQGFRVGGVNSPRAARTGEVPQIYNPDIVDNFEIGIKSQWLDNRLTVNASAFYMEWSDYQESVAPGQWWLRGILNVGDAETTGIELNATWRATERLSLAANLFAADPEFTDNFCAIYVGNTPQPCPLLPNGEPDPDELEVRAGMPLPNSPKRTGTFSISYEIPNVLGGDLWFYYDISYSSEIWNSTANILDNDTDGISPSWTFSTFSAGLQLPNQFNIELNVRNVTNESGYSYVWTGEADNAALFDDPRYRRIRAQDRPRTVWLTLRKGFGGT